MINTEVFHSKEEIKDLDCIKEVLKNVNQFIEKVNIQKEDILEYSTKIIDKHNGFRIASVYLSYWTEEE